VRSKATIPDTQPASLLVWRGGLSAAIRGRGLARLLRLAAQPTAAGPLRAASERALQAGKAGADQASRPAGISDPGELTGARVRRQPGCR